MGRGSIAKHHPAWNPQCRQKSRKLLFPKPKVMPRFSLEIGDIGEARWLLSHRWTETSPILPDVAHDGHNQRRVVSLSLSALSLSSPRASDSASCAKFIPTYLQQALITDAERTTTTVRLHISDVSPARYAQGSLSILRAYVACAAEPTSSGASPVWGVIGPCRGVLPRTNAWCVVGQ